MMTLEDLDRVPLVCQGTHQEVRERIATLGSAAVLAFDGERHVGQLQFRRYDPMLRSARGIWDPAYWGDFGEHAPKLPPSSVAVFCYHVGQLDESEYRDPAYAGRGIGLALVDSFIAWAAERGFAAITAKHTPPYRPIMGFMGGQPAETYRSRGFEVVADWVDGQLQAAVADRGLAPPEADPGQVARVGCCVKQLR